MYQPGGQPPRPPEMNFDQMLGSLGGGLGRIASRLGGGGVGLAAVLIIALIVIIWAATGIYTISPGEQAALRLFGAAQANTVTDTGLALVVALARGQPRCGAGGGNPPDGAGVPPQRRRRPRRPGAGGSPK